MTRTRIGRWGRGFDTRRSRCPQRVRSAAPPPIEPVFGNFCRYSDLALNTVSTSVAYVSHQTFNTVVEVGAQWWVSFGVAFQTEQNPGDIDVRLRLDADVLFEEQGNTGFNQGTNGNLSPSGQFIVGGGPVVIAAGPRTLAVEFRRVDGPSGASVSVYRSYVELFYWSEL